MARVIRYDRVTLDGAKRRTRASDGALVIPGKFARIGLQSYEQGDGTVRVELRPEDEVAASGATFAGVTVTDEHPEGMVSPGTWRTLARGHVEAPRFEDGWLIADFVVHDAEAALKIERGDLIELSAGYTAETTDESGEYDGIAYQATQRSIVGNHIALLPEGMARAGRDARLVLDSSGNQIPDGCTGRKREEDMEEEEKDPEAKEEEDTLDSLRADRDRVQAELDAALAKVADLEAKLTAASKGAGDSLSEMVSARVALLDRARRLAGDSLDIVGTDTEIRCRALKASGVDVAGRSDAYIEARFDVAVESAQAHRITDQIPIWQASTTPRADSDPMQPLIDALTAREED